MNKKINKLIFLTATCFTTLLLLNACATDKKKETQVTQDCSAIFETRYIKGSNKAITHKKAGGNNETSQGEESVAPTECKVLEVKFDKDIKCELVGSNKIDDLSKAVSENKDNKIVLIAPQDQLKSISKMTEKYLQSVGFDITKYFDTDMFKSFSFPYKGMRCNVSDKQVVVWSGDKKVIVTIKNN